MKNFKVIISLLALLTASDALPMTGAERLAARNARKSGATTEQPTQVTPVEVAPTTTGRRGSRAQATPVTQVAPVQTTSARPMTGAERRAARQAGATVTQAAPVQVAAPTTTNRRGSRAQATPVTQVAPVQSGAATGAEKLAARNARRGGATPAPVAITAPQATTVTEQIVQAPVGTQEDEFNGGYPLLGIPAGKSFDQETIYFKVGDIFYDQDRKTIKPAGVKKYVDMVKKETGLKDQDLVSKTYEDAVQILKVVRRENTNAPLAVKLFKSLCAQLMTAITDVVFPEVAAKKQTVSSTMKSLENSANWSAFVAASTKNRTLFYNQEWFDLAARMAKKFNPGITDEKLEDMLILAASNIFGGEKMSADTANVIKDFAVTALWSLPEETAVRPNSAVQAIEEKKIRLREQLQQEKQQDKQLKVLQPKSTAVMQELENAKNWNDFKAITDSNIKVFYDNGELQQKWFNLAAKKAQKFNPTMTESQRDETLTKTAEQLFLTATGKLLLSADDKDSISAAASIAAWDLPL